MFGHPPANVSPARLFRLLLQKPRPSIPIDHRLHGAPPITVRALRGREASAALDDAAQGVIAEVAVSIRSAALVAAAAFVAGRPLFATADDARDLYEDDFVPLRDAVIRALGTVSPIYGLSNESTWMEALTKGARDPSNRGDANAIRLCHDVAFGAVANFNPRPDRFFGMALSDLTDGQLMAFRAARLDIK